MAGDSLGWHRGSLFLEPLSLHSVQLPLLIRETPNTRVLGEFISEQLIQTVSPLPSATSPESGQDPLGLPEARAR